jgi:hypothetical protein
MVVKPEPSATIGGNAGGRNNVADVDGENAGGARGDSGGAWERERDGRRQLQKRRHLHADAGAGVREFASGASTLATATAFVLTWTTNAGVASAQPSVVLDMRRA